MAVASDGGGAGPLLYFLLYVAWPDPLFAKIVAIHL
jgi:hypothetical protein